MSGSEVQEKLLVPLHGIEDERLRNVSRDYTISFCMPSNGNIYIAGPMNAFRLYICGWMGVVNDCHFLHLRCLDRAFMKFDLYESMNIFNESYEDVSIIMD